MRREWAKEWLDFAGRDLKVSKILGDNENYDGAAYHLQQAVEKSLKAVLVFYDLRVPSREFRTHSIAKLIDLLERGNINVPDFIKDARSLTRYAFTTRYPDDYIPVSLEEYEEAYEIAVRVYEWAKGIVEDQP